MNSADHYLRLPQSESAYTPSLGWSPTCDAVVHADGRSLAVVEEVQLLLEGIFSTAERPPFQYVLKLLDWCRRGDSPREPSAARVWERLRPLVASAHPSPRNLGLLFAFLCEGLPPALVVPSWAELNTTLERRRLFGERTTADPFPGPPLSIAAFATRIDDRLRTVPNRQLVGLLLTGERDLPDAEPVAHTLLSFPERLAAALAEFRRRDRLVGAAFLAPLIDGALALPLRRPTPDRLPQGGYADVTTRGIPDRLLPSQFALDPDEFVRRFADNELLYFRREEPHAPETPSRVLLLDQGVRTWGPVRLGLAGAAVAVLTRDPARFAAVSVGVTSADDFLDPWAVTADELATRLERSDLSAHPAGLLARALRRPNDGPRDIVLLTHPRNAREPAVREALLDLRPEDRLFTLTLDDAGEAELFEADDRGQRSVRRFRIDLTAAAAVKVAAPTLPPARVLPTWSARPWTGDIEPVPFPFRAGFVTDVESHITFDADATWVVVLGRGGALHAKRVNSDEPLEVLPRPLWRGQLLGEVLALLPLRDGFALVATGGPCLSEGHYVAGYNFAACTVKCFKLCGMMPSGEFLSFPDTNCIAVRCSQFVPVTRWVIVADFTSCESVHHDHGNPSTSLDPRASEAACRAIERARTEYPVPAAVNTASLDPSPSLHREQGAVWLSLPGGKQVWLTPTAEGKPIFQQATLTKAVLSADTLAVVATEGKLSSLWALRVSDSAVLHQQGDVSPKLALTLSPDGRWLARQTVAGRTVEVRALGGAAVERLANGGYHNAFAMHLSAECLQVVVGRYRHRFALDQIPFAYEATASDRANGWHRNVIDPTKVLTAYDGKRFGTPAAAGPWVAVHDHWGQVVLMNAVGDLVMHVCVCREMWAVVLPDGTRCGSAALLGGAPTPDAERLVGEWLRKLGG